MGRNTENIVSSLDFVTWLLIWQYVHEGYRKWFLSFWFLSIKIDIKTLKFSSNKPKNAVGPLAFG